MDSCTGDCIGSLPGTGTITPSSLYGANNTTPPSAPPPPLSLLPLLPHLLPPLPPSPTPTVPSSVLHDHVACDQNASISWSELQDNFKPQQNHSLTSSSPGVYAHQQPELLTDPILPPHLTETKHHASELTTFRNWNTSSHSMSSPPSPIHSNCRIANEHANNMDETLARAKQCLSPISQQMLGDRRTNRRSSGDIPRQTIIKAMASRSMHMTGATTTHGSTGGSSSVALTSFSSMSQALAEANAKSAHKPGSSSPTLAAIAASKHMADMMPISIPPATLSASVSASLLRSPCFFHQRFEGLVDIQKVLEEIKDVQEAEEEYSHSRLMQTATGVREVSKQLQRKPLKSKVRSVMIVTRARDNSLVLMTRELAEWLLTTPRYGTDVGVTVYVDAKLKHSKRFDAPSLVSKDERFKKMLRYWTPDLCWSNPEKFDLVLTLGGDGTVLFTSWLFQRVVPPILSFALGSLGFLTNFEFAQYKKHLTDVMVDKGMRVNLRMRFTCTVWRKDTSEGAEKGSVEEGEQFEVLNELVIDRGPSAYVSNLELYGDDELLTVVQADGCIFSTPTGSTAYSLSAGGSLIHPSIPAILLTPICPHTLSFRPMVLSDTLSLRIAVPQRSRSSAYCSFDGKGRIELKQGDYVTLEASQYPFPTVMTGTNEWVESVQRALRWNVRGAEQKGWAEGNEEGDEGEQEWDIDIGDANGVYTGTDSGIDMSEAGDSESVAGTQSAKHGTQSPSRRATLNLLNM